jgi:hypothetical protein
MRKNRIEEGKKDPMAGENKQERIGEKSQKPKNKEKPRKQRKKPEEAITRKTEKKKKKRTRTRKRGEGIPFFAFYCHPPSTSKSHHIGFHPVLEESPSSPLPPQSSRDFFSAPFYEKYGNKASSC